MGFGPFSSESTSTSRTYQSDQRASVSDQGFFFQPRQSAGRHSTLLAPGATQIRIGGSYNADADVVQAALNASTVQAAQFGDTLSEIVANQTEQQQGLLSQTFGQLTELANSVQSKSGIDPNKIVLWLSLAALAVVAFALSRR